MMITDMCYLFDNIVNYSQGFKPLVRIIRLEDTKQIDEQYDKIIRDLSQAMRAFTSKDEDVARFVICTHLNNYVEPVDKRPSGLFRVLKGIRLRKNATIEKNIIKNLAQSKL